MRVCPRILVAICFSTLLMAQIDRATLNGTVTDTSGAVAPGVKVEALSATTGKEREVITNERGIYLIPAIPVYGGSNSSLEMDVCGNDRCTLGEAFR